MISVYLLLLLHYGSTHQPWADLILQVQFQTQAEQELSRFWFNLYQEWFNTPNAEYDEIRIGSTFAQVTPQAFKTLNLILYSLKDYMQSKYNEPGNGL